MAAILARWLTTVVPAGCTVSAAAGAVTTAFRSPVASITVDVAALAGDQQSAGTAAAAFAIESALDSTQDVVVHGLLEWWPVRSTGEAESVPRVEVLDEQTLRVGYADHRGWLLRTDIVIPDA